MKPKPKFTSIRVDMETRDGLGWLAELTERSIPKMVKFLVLKAKREMAEQQEAPNADAIPESR